MIGKLLSGLLVSKASSQYIMDLPEEFVELSSPHPHHNLEFLKPFPKAKRMPEPKQKQEPLVVQQPRRRTQKTKAPVVQLGGKDKVEKPV